jgi:hypothetical protein
MKHLTQNLSKRLKFYLKIYSLLLHLFCLAQGCIHKISVAKLAKIDNKFAVI